MEAEEALERRLVLLGARVEAPEVEGEGACQEEEEDDDLVLILHYYLYEKL